MIIIISMWVIGIVLVLSNPYERYTQFVGLAAFFAGCHGLASMLEKNHDLISAAPQLMLLFIGLLWSMSYYWSNYALLLAAILYSNVIPSPKRFKYVAVLLALPVLLMYFLFPIYPEFKISMANVTPHVMIYIILTNLLIIGTFLKEKNIWIKKQHLITILYVTPQTLIYLMIIYVIPAYFPRLSMGKLLDEVVVGGFLVFIILAVRYGLLGVKFRIEKYQIGIALEAVTSGTKILTHTIKNKIDIINMGTEIITNILQDEKVVNHQAYETLDIIQKSTDHLAKMIERIHEKTKPITLIKEEHSLLSLIELSINDVKPIVEEKKIKIELIVSDDFHIIGDKTHLLETFINIFSNAIEALKTEAAGLIKVHIYPKNRYLIVAINDNGAGISTEDLPHVIEPFFSTKHQSQNYGLGLSYCYSVLQKHGGTLTIESKVNVGTTVFLKFPYISRLSVINRFSVFRNKNAEARLANGGDEYAGCSDPSDYCRRQSGLD